MRHTLIGASALALAASLMAAPAQAQFIGQIKAFAFDFCPLGWVAADGRTLPISQYEPLFSLYGTQYGGDGTTSFAVPNLNTRFAMGAGNGPDGTSWRQGTMTGAATTTLSASQLPLHHHSFGASTEQASENDPSGRVPGSFANVDAYAPPGTSNVQMNPVSVSETGGSQPISVQDPYLAVNFCVAVDGEYPPHP